MSKSVPLKLAAQRDFSVSSDFPVPASGFPVPGSYSSSHKGRTWWTRLNTPGNGAPDAMTEINFGLPSAGSRRLARHGRPRQGSTYLRTYKFSIFIRSPLCRNHAPRATRWTRTMVNISEKCCKVSTVLQFSVLSSRFLVLGSWFLVPGSWFLVPGSWFLVLGSQFFVLGSRFSVLGSWFSVLGSWFLVPGSWFSVLGSWFSVLGSRLSVLSNATPAGPSPLTQIWYNF